MVVWAVLFLDNTNFYAFYDRSRTEKNVDFQWQSRKPQKLEVVPFSRGNSLAVLDEGAVGNFMRVRGTRFQRHLDFL